MNKRGIVFSLVVALVLVGALLLIGLFFAATRGDVTISSGKVTIDFDLRSMEERTKPYIVEIIEEEDEEISVKFDGSGGFIEDEGLKEVEEVEEEDLEEENLVGEENEEENVEELGDEQDLNETKVNENGDNETVVETNETED